MEEAISFIFQGCKLAQDLERNLQHYVSNNQLLPPPILMLSESCDEIIKMFVSAKERLISNPLPSSSYSPPPPQLFSVGHDASLHEWLRSAMAAGSGSSTSVQVPVTGTTQLDSGQLLFGSSPSSSQQRPRRRGYYRCTHQKMYQCPAKRQVQRLDHDPYTFQVTYRGNHTCHMSSTAPSIAPPTHMAATSSGTHQLPSPPPWLEFNLGGGGSSSGSTMAATAGGSSGADIAAAGPSSYLVAEMADAMFNSGSSSTNSMEFLFPSPQDKWDPEDSKNN
ncbi:WRKY transcription factor 55-like isoform X2 [Tripterygium wilfordii]|uniref:WRKY transcription factor 55-like isoform X2 n=1 Tax=Tripterygium wilfordii TaxID=458696 RepID=UPI0018F80E16|nr:WRKY transcription factor 55-like isoform X2 [Tripterygium wilfordii]